MTTAFCSFDTVMIYKVYDLFQNLAWGRRYPLISAGICDRGICGNPRPHQRETVPQLWTIDYGLWTS